MAAIAKSEVLPILNEIQRLRSELDSLELRVVGEERRPRDSCARIIKLVSSEWGIHPAEITEHGQHVDRLEARQAAMYLACRCTALSVSQIGASMGGFHHSTVLNSLKVITGRREKSNRLDTRLAAIEERLSE